MSATDTVGSASRKLDGIVVGLGLRNALDHALAQGDEGAQRGLQGNANGSGRVDPGRWTEGPNGGNRPPPLMKASGFAIFFQDPSPLGGVIDTGDQP